MSEEQTQRTPNEQECDRRRFAQARLDQAKRDAYERAVRRLDNELERLRRKMEEQQ